MFAARIVAPSRIELVDCPEPALSPSPRDSSEPGEILFQPEIACLCGSDLPYFDHRFEEARETPSLDASVLPMPAGEPVYPRQLGHSLHEMVGRVVATNGRRFRAGDRVLAVPVNQVGFFERYVVSEARAVPLDTRVPAEQALLAQPLGTVIFALKKLPALLDADAAVVGQGPIGMLFNLCLRQLGARRIVGIEPVASRRARSAVFGATAALDPAAENIESALRDATSDRGPDLVIEAVGHRAQALNDCIRHVRHGGRILYFGVPPRELNGIRFLDLWRKNATLHTSVNPDFAHDFPLAMQWIGERRIDVAPLITHRFPVARIQEAFLTFLERRDGALKVLVEFPH